jgi:hypothetical protein
VQPVAIADLADELGTRKQSLFKIAKRLGVQWSKQREVSRGNQLIAVVTAESATAIRAEFLGARSRGGTDIDGLPLDPDEGWFYVIQLEPEFDPGRVKVGFTTDLEGRLRHHRCSAPFASYTRTWPCRRAWERAAIDCLTFELVQLHTEVFRTSSIDEVVARGEKFFDVMPTVRMVAEADDEDMAARDYEDRTRATSEMAVRPAPLD